MERRLATILCAHVHGYSHLMGEDEEATLRTLSAYRKIGDNLIESRRGRFVNAAGDSVLAEFISVVEAVNCAVEIQNALKAENLALPHERRMEFRISVNSGDVMVEGEQIYGDGVNVAARLEILANPGGICISDTVYKQTPRNTYVEQDAHRPPYGATAWVRRTDFASSSTAITCSRVTLGKSMRNSSNVSPASR